MNANLNHTSYRMHELTRDAALQHATHHRLARQATGFEGVSLAGLLERRAIRTVLAVVILFVALAALATSSQAQGMALAEPGTTEPYHPALVSFRIGIYYQDSGRHQEAVALFSEMVEAFPGIAEGWAARADSFSALGEYERAIDDYSAAVAIAPNLVSALSLRGDAYQRSGAFELAVADYQDAIGQMPEYAAPHAGLAETYALMGLQADALTELDAYLMLAGADADPARVVRAAALRQTAEAGAA